MSLRAYLTAVRDAIRSEFGVDELGCEVCPDGRTVPMAGQQFFSVFPGTVENGATLYLDERVAFSVCLTLRTGVPPQDRIGVNVILDENGLLALADRLKALLHMNYTVMNAANDMIPGFPTTVNGFTEPLAFLSLQYLGPRSADWFFADGSDECGVAAQLNFGRARRVQANDVMT